MPPKKKVDPGPPPKKSKISDFFTKNTTNATFVDSPADSPSRQEVSLHILASSEKEAKKILSEIPHNLDVVVQGAEKLDSASDDTLEDDVPASSQPSEPITPPFTVEYDSPPTNYKQGRRQPSREAYDITNHLEEGLFATGLDMMRETAISDVKVDLNGNKKVKELHIPTCQQLQIAMTILVHPDFTTSIRPWEVKKPKDYRAAVKALKAVMKTFSPADLRMDEVIKCRIEYASKLGAAAAKKARETRIEKNGRGEAGKTGMSEIFEGEEVCDSIYVQDECVFNQGGDMWELVAWMLSCSVKKRKRWEYWKRLAEIMVSTWEVDWWRCINGQDGYESKDAIFVGILPPLGGTAFKRCVKAAWARGEKEWRPWFENETKRYRKRQWQPWEVTPLKEELDLMDPEEELSDDEVDLEDDGLLDPAAGLGGREAVDLRCRLMALIASTSDYGFFGNGQTIAVFEEFRDFYSLLSFPQFIYMVSAHELLIEDTFRSSLNQLMIEDFLSTDSYFYSVSEKAKKKKPGDPEYEEAEEMHIPFSFNQRKVELCFLPYPALSSSIVENAKMNVLVEQLIRSLIDQGLFKYSPAFEDAVYTGINARREAVASKEKLPKLKKKAVEKEDVKAVGLLNAISEWNMKILMMERRQMVLNGDPEEKASYTPAERDLIAHKNGSMACSDATLARSLEIAQQQLEDYKLYRKEHEAEIQAKKEAEKAERRQKQLDLRNAKAVKKLKASKAINSDDEKLLLSPGPNRTRKPNGGSKARKKKTEREHEFDDIPIINPKFRFTDEDLDRYDSDEDIVDPFTGQVHAMGGLLKKVPVTTADKQDNSLMDADDEEADISKFGLKVANSDDEEGDSDDDLEFTKEERQIAEMKKRHIRNLREILDEETELSSLDSDVEDELEGMVDAATLLKQIKEGVGMRRN